MDGEEIFTAIVNWTAVILFLILMVPFACLALQGCVDFFK